MVTLLLANAFRRTTYPQAVGPEKVVSALGTGFRA